MVSTRSTPKKPKVATKKPKAASKKKKEATFLGKGRYKDNDHMNYKCNTQVFQKFWIHVKKELGTENSKLLIAELKQTPFWNLINAFDQNLLEDRKPDKLFGKLIKRFDHAENRFRFGNRLYSITTVDVHNILGLKDNGAKLPLPYKRYKRTIL